MLDLISPNLTDRTDELQRQFRTARPFRHLVMDEFLAPALAADLLGQFPAFERGSALAEDGSIGNKATVERIRRLGPAYQALDTLVQSPSFLHFVGAITGIPDLLYDPWYFGGGTHENRHGQDLDAHVDFNRHPVERWHRRLNLIVYLNRRWDAAWGGALQLHADPRTDDEMTVTIAPLFNRAVVFETTEWSWHSFPPIILPDDERTRTRTRKSIALYFYSTERPADELADTHSTIYVDRPLPPHLRAGHVLDDADMDALHVLLHRRDMHNQRLYGEISALSARLESAETALASGGIGRLAHLARRLLHRLRART
jgi:hypothetical protein